MGLDWIFYLNLICSVFGIIFFIYCLFIISKIKEIFPSGSVVKKWVRIQILIIIFLGGYIFNIVFLLFEQNTFINFMTAIIYLFGGLFVLIIIDMSYKTYQTILLQSSSKKDK
ncbi:MAG: hypothetical protein ACTSPD_05385 [Promethearchaeota archaeon]